MYVIGEEKKMWPVNRSEMNGFWWTPAVSFIFYNRAEQSEGERKHDSFSKGDMKKAAFFYFRLWKKIRGVAAPIEDICVNNSSQTRPERGWSSSSF